MIEHIDFSAVYQRFQDLVVLATGDRFTRFDEGTIHTWESYKPRLRDHALSILGVDTWIDADVGSGRILDRVVAAIEIQDNRRTLNNNLVFWQNRFGHANREHRALLEARATPRATQDLERRLFDLYAGNVSHPSLFEDLSRLTGSKYPLLAYLFFLKDIDRYMPIQPSGFDRVFREIGLDFRTLRQCSWDNYSTFNSILDELRGAIATAAGLRDVRLVDAHSFLWFYTSLLRRQANGVLDGTRISEKTLEARERSIADIKYSVNKTVFNSNGQIVERKVKDKELRMSDYELDRRIRELLDLQGGRCAISGLPFQYRGAHDDENMLPSLDRIDSDGHYEAQDVQLVCRFINFWKQASDDDEFRRLINVVRGAESSPASTIEEGQLIAHQPCRVDRLNKSHRDPPRHPSLGTDARGHDRRPASHPFVGVDAHRATGGYGQRRPHRPSGDRSGRHRGPC